MRLKKNKYAPSWLMSKWFLVVVLFVLFFISTSLVKEYYRSYQINKEIALLKEQISELEYDNQETSDFVEYLKTDRYFQEQARLKFGLKEAGEKVVVLKGHDEQGEEVVDDYIVFQQEKEKEKTNPSKWFAYFFSPR